MPLAIVLADFVAECEEEISATEGTIVELVSYEEDEWSEIIVDGAQGIFPSSYLELYEEEDIGEEEGDQEYDQENGEENYEEYDQTYDEGYENDDANNYDYDEGDGGEEQPVEPIYEEPVEDPIEETPPPEPVVQPSPTLARESSLRNVGRPLPVPQGPPVQAPPKEDVKLVVSAPPAGVNVQQVKETANNSPQLQPNNNQPRQPSPQRTTNSPGPVRGGPGGPVQPNRGSPVPGQRGRGGPAGSVAGASPGPVRGGSNRGGPGGSNPTARPLPTPTGPPVTQQDKAKAGGAGPTAAPATGPQGGAPAAGPQGGAPAGAPKGNIGPRGGPGGAQGGQVRGGPGPNRGQRGGPAPVRGGPGPVQRGGPGPVRGGPGQRGGQGQPRGAPGPARGGQGQRGGPVQRTRGGPIVAKVEKVESESESDSEELSAESAEQSEDTPEEIAAKAESDAKHRANVIAELITTEKDYVKDLLIIEEVFSKPLRQQQIIPEDDLTLLFSNLSVIITVNTKLLGLLTVDEQDSLMVGAIFCQMADFLKMYTDFCANQPKLTTALDRLQKNPAFAAFLAQCMTNEECRGLTLFSFLIKPIQRICKYPLLLKDLLKHTPSAHSDYEKLESALQKIEFVVSYVNERKRIAENLQKIIDVKDQIESTEELNLVEPSRRFVREGAITVIEKGRTRTRKTFVFNDLIVLTKERKSMMGNVAKDHFKAKFFLNDIKIVDIADTEDIKYACDVRPKDETKQKFSFVFVFPSAKEKSDWVKEIKLLVKQFQKKAAEAAKKAQAARAEAEALGIPYEDPTAFHLDDHQDNKEKDKKEKEKADKKDKEEKEKAVKEVKPDKKPSGSKRSQFGSLRSTKSSKSTKLPKIAPLGAPPPHAGAVAVYARPPPPKGHQLTRTATPQKNSSASGIFKIFGGDGKDTKVKKTK